MLENFMKNAKRFFKLMFIFISLSQVPVFSQEASDVASSAFLQGTTAYRNNEWVSAVFLLRKAVSYPENFNADTYYMLISAQMYSAEYKTALQDCELFLSNFAESPYTSFVVFHKGKALFFLGQYEKSVLQLGDFCHQYPEHEMYASALYWIAESFFASYNYDEAKMIYSRIVSEYSNDSKAPAAQFRLETIEQSAREEKLLYLLKETGEEYLSAKEEYERQLKLADSENSFDVRKRLMDLQRRNSDLEKQVAELNARNSELATQLETEKQLNNRIKNENDDMIESLKQKAWKTQQLLNQRTSAEVGK